MQAWGSLHQWQQLGLGLGHDLEDVRGCLPTERENPCRNWQDHQLSLSLLLQLDCHIMRDGHLLVILKEMTSSELLLVPFHCLGLTNY